MDIIEDISLVIEDIDKLYEEDNNFLATLNVNIKRGMLLHDISVCNGKIKVYLKGTPVNPDNKIITVQEIWGDGDSYPMLINLKLFKNRKIAEEYCMTLWCSLVDRNDFNLDDKCILRPGQELIVYSNIKDVDDIEDCSYNLFSGVLIEEREVN